MRFDRRVYSMQIRLSLPIRPLSGLQYDHPHQTVIKCGLFAVDQRCLVCQGTTLVSAARATSPNTISCLQPCRLPQPDTTYMPTDFTQQCGTGSAVCWQHFLINPGLYIVSTRRGTMATMRRHRTRTLEIASKPASSSLHANVAVPGTASFPYLRAIWALPP